MKMKIDPSNITNFNMTKNELENVLLFWVLAAGKNGVTAAKCLYKLLNNFNFDYGYSDLSPFDLIRKKKFGHKVSKKMKEAGIGCYNRKAITFLELAHSGFDLKTCSVEDLESIYGIGRKTSRCFIIHSRPNQRLAGLDVHNLKFLKSLNYVVPKSTPSSNKRYKQIEQWYLDEVDKSGKDVATFDLEIWNMYRKKKEIKEAVKPVIAYMPAPANNYNKISTLDDLGKIKEITYGAFI